MKFLNKCIICKNTEFTNYMSCVDFTVSQKSFKIVECVKCGFLFTNPRPKNDNLAAYYLSEDYISHTNNTRGILNSLYQLARKYTLKNKLKLITKISTKGSLLDVGCGTGEFLNICQKTSWITCGVEPSKKARDQGVQNYNLEIYSELNTAQFENTSFDVITMWHVLEHLPNIESTLETLKKIITSEGKLIIAVPNYRSWDASYYKEFWAAYDVPIHLWHFSKTSITNLLKKYNFNLIESKGMFLDAFYVSILSEKYKSGTISYFKALIIGLVSNLIGLCSNKEYSSFIYIFEKDAEL